MSEAEPTMRIGVMEGGGAYNRNAALQRAGGRTAWPLLERAARELPIADARGPVVIADYGASQGRNSLAPIRAAIAILRDRLGGDRPIAVVHTDLPGNDFGTLFGLLRSDDESYANGAPEVYAYAVGRSFYETLFPPGTVWLGWSSFAAHWLSRVPVVLSDRFHPERTANPAAAAAYDAQADTDWRCFLRCRASELRSGGRLVILVPAAGDGGVHPLDKLFDHVNHVLAELVTAGAISPGEYGRMATGEWPQTGRELQSPFEATGSFCDLRLQHFEMEHAPDPLWDDFVADRDARRLAEQRAKFFRSAFGPTLASVLDAGRPAGDATAFAERLEKGLASRLAADPWRLTYNVAMMMFEKAGASAPCE